MLGKAEIRAIVAENLGIAQETIGDDDDLVSLGMHSMMLMRLASKWRKQGYDVRSSSLALEPTIGAWAGLLGVPESAAPDQPGTEESRSGTDEFALATMQHAYWVGRRQDQRLGGVAAHLYVEFDGAGMDAERLRRAAERLLRRHDMLRAQFLDSGTQRIMPEPPLPVCTITDLAGADPEVAATELARIRQDKSHQRMDIAAGRVVDIAVTLLPDGGHRLHLDVDMVAADAQSYRRILDDLAALYESDTADPNPVGYTFRDYLSAKERTTQDNSADRQWWERKLPELPDIPSLPVLPESERRDPSRSIRLHHWFDAAAKARLHAKAHGHGVTPAVALATVFGEVIARWSARQRFLLNVPLFNREPLHDEIDRVVGDFTNSVLVDVDASVGESMVARAKRLQRELHTCAAHSGYEGLDVLRDLGRLRGAPVTPSVVFTSGLDLGELFSERVIRTLGTPVWILSQGPQVDLDAQVVELHGGLLVNWDIRRDALPAGVADAMFEQFRRTLDALVEPDADWTADLRVELPADQRAVRAAANDSAFELGTRTLHGAFFELARRQPERTALRWRDGGTLDYGELADQALAVAHALTEAGVRPGDTVAVILPKGHRQIPAVLGVLAAGAAYLPIGTDQPNLRRDRILLRGNVSVALVEDVTGVPDGVTALPLADALTDSRLPRPHDTDPDAVAYVLFTSGSTGEPKGVEVSHRAAANTIDAIDTRFGIGADDRTIGLSALGFDLSVYDIFGPLSRGGALVCVDTASERDAAAWAELIAEAGVTVLNCAPGLVTMLADTATPDQLTTLRLVLTGGDRVKTQLAQRLRSTVPGLRFVGLGGTTETAIHSTVCEVTDDFPAEWANVPYGKPLANVRLRVVNERGEDCPDWVPGELWIGGASVADGYRGDPERTADRFVESAGVRWYRTGDLARYLPDGTVDFLGRADHQVKIRGYRVELGEVESALAALPGVDEAVALRTEAGRLAAAVRATALADEITAALRKMLPSYMIPDRLEVRADLPLTANGKLDRAAIRRALGADDPAARAAYVAPADAVEAAVEFIAAQVLGAERIGVETDFFDAGGDSILATRFTGQIRGLLAVSDFGVTGVFDGRTVRGIAAGLRATEANPQRLEQVCRILLELAEVRVPEPAPV
ncbi:non-ribosomal peptide synthetase [Nocardia arthritidis]|uniref:Phenyloxazoline synthase MbtB n=1 Tax=Nocardia arthritidis TaxID=228602 RepID=A0A6G9Y6T5_9NOCA|nr:non-ribosomal peptide synthetase [Nocardia arthritidis]QIS08921.1 amino acid adenylation domain-containing protein [Nocardia arthritidis]